MINFWFYIVKLYTAIFVGTNIVKSVALLVIVMEVLWGMRWWSVIYMMRIAYSDIHLQVPLISALRKHISATQTNDIFTRSRNVIANVLNPDKLLLWDLMKILLVSGPNVFSYCTVADK